MSPKSYKRSKGENKEKPLTLEQVRSTQKDAEALQGRIEEILLRANKLQKKLIEDFFRKFKEKGLDLPRERLQDIKREIADIRQKQKDYLAILAQVSQLKDLIKLKRALIQILDNEEFKKIIHRQKITEILIKNWLLLRLLLLVISKLFELKILMEKLNIESGPSQGGHSEDQINDSFLDELRENSTTFDKEQDNMVSWAEAEAPDIYTDFMEIVEPQELMLDEVEITSEAIRMVDFLLHCPNKVS